NLDGVNQFLSIFANVSAFAADQLTAETGAQLVDLSLPSTAEFSVSRRTAVAPRALLDLSGRSVGDGPRERPYSADGGAWWLSSSATQISVTDRILWLQGRHYVDVRARAAGLPQTLDPTPERIELLVDTVAPEGSYDVAGGQLVFHATDRVSPPGALRY